LGGRAIATAADVSQAAAVAKMVGHVASALGPIDILINNAGMAIVRGIDDLTESEFDQTIAVNLKSAFLCTQAVPPAMRAKKWWYLEAFAQIYRDVAEQLGARLSEAGVQLTELSTHLQGQLVAVHPAYDAAFDGFAAPEVRGNPHPLVRCPARQLPTDLHCGRCRRVPPVPAAASTWDARR
jgi:NAD(P)-dependent dehydrogenase (short-subunit alcohol dehydrogenase family)